MSATRNRFIRVLAALAILIALPASLRAHVVLEQRQAAVGAPYKAVLKVTHGCAGSATTSVTVSIPDGVIGVKPMPKPGWRLETTRGPYDRTYDFYHGTKLSEGVRQITWSGGRLEDAHYDEFVLSGVIADTLQAGATIYFPVVQTCETGVHRWVQRPDPADPARHLDEPAPALSLIANPRKHP